MILAMALVQLSVVVENTTSRQCVNVVIRWENSCKLVLNIKAILGRNASNVDSEHAAQLADRRQKRPAFRMPHVPPVTEQNRPARVGQIQEFSTSGPHCPKALVEVL